jgi:hypothetical protein
LPPLLAEVVVILVIAAVVTVGISSLLHENKIPEIMRNPKLVWRVILFIG